MPSSRFEQLNQAARQRTLVMGILNVTPDSFSDGGLFLAPEAALRRAEEMLREGADLLDLGGESTRPGAPVVGAEEELKRVLPVAELIKKKLPEAYWSIDTQKARVAEEALQRGACMINDVSALRSDPEMLPLAAKSNCGVVLMHRLEAPPQMKWSTEESKRRYPRGVVLEVAEFLAQRAREAEQAGVARERIWIDPGFGFGKSVEDNLSLLKNLPTLLKYSYPVLMGTSRKSSLGAVLGGLSANERLEATAASVAIACWLGAACVRVHDVKEMVRIVRVTQAIRGAGN